MPRRSPFRLREIPLSACASLRPRLCRVSGHERLPTRNTRPDQRTNPCPPNSPLRTRVRREGLRGDHGHHRVGTLPISAEPLKTCTVPPSSEDLMTNRGVISVGPVDGISRARDEKAAGHADPFSRRELGFLVLPIRAVADRFDAFLSCRGSTCPAR